MADGQKLLLTVEEARERLGIGKNTMYDLVATGEVESIRIGGKGGGIRIPVRSLETYIERHIQKTKSAG